MTKWKKILIWCLTAALLVLGGSMPILASLVGDRIEQGIQYRDMESLELIFQSSAFLSAGEKLVILQNSITEETWGVEPAEPLQDTLNELLPVVFAQLDSYAAAGVLPYTVLGAELATTDAFLMYLPQKPEVNATMWTLGFAIEGEEKLSVVVDGDMGHILALEYRYWENTAEADVQRADDADLEPYVDLVAYQYFRCLELPATEIDVQYLKDGISKTFRVETEYGNVYIVFDIFQSNISIYPN